MNNYSYYIHNNLLYRFKNIENLYDDITNLQVHDGINWVNHSDLIKSFMNDYLTGWINENDVIVDYNTAKQELAKQKYFRVKDFAITAHREQKYGIYNYEVHLVNVVSILFRHGIFISDKNYNILASAWLHDILEDTSISEQEFIDMFGKDIYDIVWSLTDGEAESRDDRKSIMYNKLVYNQDAIIIKLADRIANLEFSIINNNKKYINRYIRENRDLNSILENNIQTDLARSLLDYLNVLVNTQS